MLLSLTLEELFIYVANSTLHLNEKDRNVMIHNLANKLEEWDSVPRKAVVDALKAVEIKLDYVCENCGLIILDYVGIRRCAGCKN